MKPNIWIWWFSPFFTFRSWKPPIFFKSLVSLFGKIWPEKNTLIAFYGRIEWIILWWNCGEIVWLPLISYCKIILHLCFNFVKHYDGIGILLLEVLWSHRQWMVSNLLCWMEICPIGWVYMVKCHVFLPYSFLKRLLFSLVSVLFFWGLDYIVIATHNLKMDNYLILCFLCTMLEPLLVALPFRSSNIL